MCRERRDFIDFNLDHYDRLLEIKLRNQIQYALGLKAVNHSIAVTNSRGLVCSAGDRDQIG